MYKAIDKMLSVLWDEDFANVYIVHWSVARVKDCFNMATHKLMLVKRTYENEGPEVKCTKAKHCNVQ